jgi:hypothetical protein
MDASELVEDDPGDEDCAAKEPLEEGYYAGIIVTCC